MGSTRAVALDGGIKAWRAAGFPLEPTTRHSEAWRRRQTPAAASSRGIATRVEKTSSARRRAARDAAG